MPHVDTNSEKDEAVSILPFIDDLDFPFGDEIDDGEELDDGEAFEGGEAVDFSDDVEQDLDESDRDSETGGGRR